MKKYLGGEEDGFTEGFTPFVSAGSEESLVVVAYYLRQYYST
jgi:hypothetical protein